MLFNKTNCFQNFFFKCDEIIYIVSFRLVSATTNETHIQKMTRLEKKWLVLLSYKRVQIVSIKFRKNVIELNFPHRGGSQLAWEMFYCVFEEFQSSREKQPGERKLFLENSVYIRKALQRNIALPVVPY